MKLIAQKPLRYAGVSLNVGDEFEASDKDAGLLKVIGKAKDAPAVYDPVEPRREIQDDTHKPRRGRHRKADAVEVGAVDDQDD